MALFAFSLGTSNDHASIVRESWVPEPFAPPNSLTETAYWPYRGLFLFWFQRGLALAAALQRLTKCSKSVSERHFSLTERPTAPKSRLEKMYHLQ
jgi:hypothetical protein